MCGIGGCVVASGEVPSRTALEQVFRYQVVQRTPAEFDLAIVVSPDCDREGIRRRLELKFRERFGDGTVAEVSFVESLPRTGGGKVRPVISRAGHPGNG
jgi:hypothetical protein